MESNVVIKAIGLGKKYHKQVQDSPEQIPFYAVNNVSFQLERGQVLGIIGQNGSGKSTLLKLLSGLTKPSSGSVELIGTVSSILDIGTGIHPDLTGRENAYLRGQLLGMSKAQIDNVFDELVDFSGVRDFIDSPVKHYSSGMFLRLAFSIIVHLRSDILLLDEVLAVGDESFRRKCSGKLSEIVAKGTTVVLVSHDMRNVLDMCSSAMMLRKGKVAAFGAPDTVVKDSYLNSIQGGDDRVVDGSKIMFNQFNSEEIGFEVKEFCLLGSEDSHSHKFPIDTEVKVKLVYKVHNPNIQLGIGVTDLLSQQLLNESPIIKLMQDNQNLDGSFRATWTIPKGLFNPGRYFINLFVIKNDFSLIRNYNHALSFHYVSPKDQPISRFPVRTSFNINLKLELEKQPD